MHSKQDPSRVAIRAQSYCSPGRVILGKGGGQMDFVSYRWSAHVDPGSSAYGGSCQTRIVWSKLDDRARRPSGENVTQVMQ
jgi:hypothetical protein